MNIWAIDKDVSIKLLLLLLNERLGSFKDIVLDEAGLDFKSVRIWRKGEPLVRAYIYTYGQERGTYGLHLEFPIHEESDISSSMDIYEGIAPDDLVEMLLVHLGFVVDPT